MTRPRFTYGQAISRLIANQCSMPFSGLIRKCVVRTPPQSGSTGLRKEEKAPKLLPVCLTLVDTHGGPIWYRIAMQLTLCYPRPVCEFGQPPRQARPVAPFRYSCLYNIYPKHRGGQSPESVAFGSIVRHSRVYPPTTRETFLHRVHPSRQSVCENQR